jgi:excisionase family DNA binding protein
MTVQEVGRGSDDQVLYTPAQAAQRLGISEVALRSWIFRKRIAVTHIGARVFVPRDELARLAERPE